MMNVGFISLGCSKNLIDTEVLIGKFKNNKFNIVNEPKEADIIVINTCGFIESAKEEAINTILEMAEYKNGRCKFLIVMGCLVQRYYDDLVKLFPEVDLFLKIEEYGNLWKKIDDLINLSISNKIKECNKVNKTTKFEMRKIPMFQKQEFLERRISTGENYAYLKIGEGCSNMCTYCAIPYIRGLFVSRPMEEVVDEAKVLAKNGIKEVIIIAQDTTKYGIDLYGESKLAELLKRISEIDDIKWIRFLYSYPEGITDDLIKQVKENDKICKYFDIPIQHISNRILKKMNRKTSKENIEMIITKIRKEIPDVTLRTSLIVGFPSETKEDFEELLDFVKKTKFDKLGVFKYSKEENTPAARMKNQVHYKTKEFRRKKVMEIQANISKQKLKQNVGKTIEVLIENETFDGEYLVGRTSRDIPEEDGLVYIKKNTRNESLKNQLINCKIIETYGEYDFIAEIL